MNSIFAFFRKKTGKDKISFPENTSVKLPFAVPFRSQRITERWLELGFPSQEAAYFWERRCCGIICLQMAIEALTQQPPPSLYALIIKVKDRGGYQEDAGWMHQSLADEAKVHGFAAFTRRRATPEEIAGYINQDKVVIASVGVRFEGERRNGHLVVVVGYRTKEACLSDIIVHHPSVRETYDRPNSIVDINQFRSHFSGNVIVGASL